MKKNYEKPQMEVVRMEQGLLNGTSKIVNTVGGNAGFKETILPGDGTSSGGGSPRASEFFDDSSEGW